MVIMLCFSCYDLDPLVNLSPFSLLQGFQSGVFKGLLTSGPPCPHMTGQKILTQNFPTIPTTMIIMAFKAWQSLVCIPRYCPHIMQPGPSQEPLCQIWGERPCPEAALLTLCPSFWSFWRTRLNPERLGCPMPNTGSPPRTCRKLGAPQLRTVPSTSIFSATSRTRK